jgi:hypothetical protein
MKLYRYGTYETSDTNQDDDDLVEVCTYMYEYM